MNESQPALESSTDPTTEQEPWVAPRLRAHGDAREITEGTLGDLDTTQSGGD
ncbi:MAG TPA: hypothetical protein VFD70_15070 [Anaerolineae bacterium]|nr:hypothetical protein [Anaerolineae bacterium]